VIVRRVLLAIDATAEACDVLERVAFLATRMQAELAALFVEDAALLRAASLPSAREVGFPSAVRHTMDAASLTRDLHLSARRAEASLAAVAARQRTRWSFRVARGSVGTELLAAAGRGDLLVLERTSRSSRPARALGSTARELLERATGALLLLERHAGLRPPVAAWIEHAHEVPRFLDASLDIAQDAVPLAYLVAGDPGRARELEAACAEFERATRREVRRRAVLDEGAVCRALADLATESGVLVAPRASAFIPHPALERLAALPRSLLLLGPSGA
jgi:hypothetical protein